MSDCSSGVCAFTPLSSQATARPDGRHLVRKPSHNSDRQTARELCRQGPSTVRTSRTAVVDTQSDGTGRTRTGAGCPRTRRHIDVGHRPEVPYCRARGRRTANTQRERRTVLGTRLIPAFGANRGVRFGRALGDTARCALAECRSPNLACPAGWSDLRQINVGSVLIFVAQEAGVLSRPGPLEDLVRRSGRQDSTTAR
jgi:hypothetical protein